jgi:hypothetical protein
VGIVREPCVSLAQGTCTEEGIYDSVALAQIAVFRACFIERVLRGQRVETVRCERDETTEFVDPRGDKGGNSQPLLHVDNRYAATKHGLWPRLL